MVEGCHYCMRHQPIPHPRGGILQKVQKLLSQCQTFKVVSFQRMFRRIVPRPSEIDGQAHIY
jgi:hypothetical protein